MGRQLLRSVRLAPLLKRLLPAATLAALLTGCMPARRDLPLVLYVAVSIQDEGQLTSESASSFRKRFADLVRNFRRIHPNVLVQVALYQEKDLVQQIRLRDWAGLGPDLILTGAEQANGLLQAGLVDPMPMDSQQRSNSSPALLQRVRNHRGQLAGQPLVVFPQLACYDRQAISSPPTTLQELLERSAAGMEVGLAIDLRQLLWTAGDFNAMPGLFAASRGQRPSAAQRQAIETWLTWLQRANNQQRFTFYPDQASLRDGLATGALDWVSCNSAELNLLRLRMGPRLGVSPLPSGLSHTPTPISRLRVMALGTNSSPVQREMALALTRFSIGPLVQRSFTLENLSFLPSNPRVSVPVQSSAALQAMVLSRQQGAETDTLLADLHSEDARVQALQEQVMVPLVFGVLEPRSATDLMISILKAGQ